MTDETPPVAEGPPQDVDPQEFRAIGADPFQGWARDDLETRGAWDKTYHRVEPVYHAKLNVSPVVEVHLRARCVDGEWYWRGDVTMEAGGDPATSYEDAVRQAEAWLAKLKAGAPGVPA